MSSHRTFRLVCLLFTLATVDLYFGRANAADQYCATRYHLAPGDACFDTIDEAEKFIREEPSPAVGAKFLQRDTPTQFDPGDFNTTYSVKPRIYDQNMGDWYSGGTTAGWGSHEFDCSPTIIPFFDGTNYACPNESALAAEAAEYWGPGFSISFHGSYNGLPPLYWGAIDVQAVTGRAYVYVPMNLLPEGGREMRANYDGIYVPMSVSRFDYFQCPQHFQGSEISPANPWPLVCTNATYAYIRKQSRQDPCRETAEGNPCIAATGNKEYRETDFDWEGRPFTRAYNSVRDLPLLSGFGDNWAHTFSDRLLLASYASSDIYWLRSDGYFELFSFVSADTYRSRISPGAIIFRESDPVAATHGRWRLQNSPGNVQWFDEVGRLQRRELGSDVLTFAYCTDAEFSQGQCIARGNLRRVTSSTGRSLAFEYESVSIPFAPGGPSDQLSDTRLNRITADGAEVAKYGFDSIGRFVAASAGGAPLADGKSYFYAEASQLCRDAAGALIPGCDPVNYSNHLTGVEDEAGTRLAIYKYDKLGRVTSSEHAGGVGKVTLAYDANESTLVTLPTGSTKEYGFDSTVFSRPVSVQTMATDGSVTGTISNRYHDFRRVSRIDANGIETTYTYDDYHEIRRSEGLVPGPPSEPTCPTGADYYPADYGSGCSGGTCWSTAPFAGGLDASSLGYGGWYYSCTIPSVPGEPPLRTTETDWHSDFNVPTERRTYDSANVLIAKSTWTYNTRGQGLTQTRTDPVLAISRTTMMTYCEQADVTAGTCPLLGLVKSVDGPRIDVSDLTTYTYRMADEASCATAPATCLYRKGDVWKITNALNQITETLKHDGARRPLSIKDANDVITDLEYHPRGWLTARKTRGINNAVETDDQINRIEYWPTGLVKKVTQPDGAFTSYTYDAAHRLTDIADNEGNTIHYTLDNAGNRIAEDTKDEQGTLLRTLSRVYNQLGQLATQADAEANPTDFVYDASGNTDTATDALGRITDNDYDPLNRLKRTLQDVGGIEAQTTFAYDAQDNLTKVTDPKGLDTVYTYNGLGDLTRLTSPDTGITDYTYDSAGNRKTQVDARAKTSTYTYDALNRLKTITYPTTSLNTTYTYDTTQAVCVAGETFTKGRLSKIADGSGTTQYCYDRFGNLVRKVQTTNAVVFTLRYAYAPGGRLSSITYPDGAVADYVRDAQGRTTEVGVTSTGGSRQVLLSQATYYPFGPAAEWVYGNGRLMHRSLNQNYQPGFVEDGFPGGISIGYEFDDVGNLAKLRSADQADPPQRAFGYDDVNRLTGVKDGVTLNLLQDYQYDDTGNRLSATAGSTTTYTYPATSHRLSQVGAVARSYDAAGNNTQIGGTARQFVYSDAGRMSQVKAGSTVTMNYLYNGKGEQVRRYLSTTNTYTVYDEAGHWIGDYNNAGVPLHQAIWLDDLPVGLLVGASPTQPLHYIEPDALGTPRVVIDPVRDVAVWTWDIAGEAFGNTAPNHDPDADATVFVFNMRFPGQRYDSASGLNYNYFRDYDPAAGRYIESDPIGLKGGVSTYAYVEGSPVDSIDPEGLVKFRWRTCNAAEVNFCMSWCPSVIGRPYQSCGARVGFRMNIDSIDFYTLPNGLSCSCQPPPQEPAPASTQACGQNCQRGLATVGAGVLAYMVIKKCVGAGLLFTPAAPAGVILIATP